MANPAPIIQTFYAEDQVFNDVKLDGVVTLVDSKHVGFHLDETKPKGVVNEAVEQIAYADRIIINKVHVSLCSDGFHLKYLSSCKVLFSIIAFDALELPETQIIPDLLIFYYFRISKLKIIANQTNF